MPHLFNLLDEIIKNPKLAIYHKDSRDFFQYLVSVPFQSIKADLSFGDGTTVRKEIPVIYRWSDTYRKAMQAKFYQLQKWYKTNPTVFTFLRLSCSSTGRTIDECFELLKKSRVKLMKAIRRVIKHKFNYVGVFEPHKSGYPHFHIILFDELDVDCDITDPRYKKNEIKLRYLWEKYEAGSFEHGLDFERIEKQKDIRDIKNYVIKYVGKSWQNSGSKYEQKPWTSNQFLFNMTLWKGHHRVWTSSRNLAKVMAWKPDESAIVPKVCFRTQLYDSNADVPYGTVWEADKALIEDCERRYDECYREKNYFAGAAG